MHGGCLVSAGSGIFCHKRLGNYGISCDDGLGGGGSGERGEVVPRPEEHSEVIPRTEECSEVILQAEERGKVIRGRRSAARSSPTALECRRSGELDVAAAERRLRQSCDAGNLGVE